MSEKITFGELIEAIAEETDNSKKFTHDFLKNFVDVINGGLEKDGKVNIAGFGKFKLRRVDEREGYNPQTDEKMTIPAHNKIVFKPYKDLRELVNAPYAHMEPKLLEDEATKSDNESNEVTDDTSSDLPADETEHLSDDVIPLTDETDQSESKQTEDTEEEAEEQDFIPTAPPTSQTHSKSESEGDDIEAESDENDPFGFETEDENDTQKEEQPIENEDDDVVEFNTESTKEEDTEELDLNDFITSIEDSKKSSESEVADSEDSESLEDLDEQEDPVTTDAEADSHEEIAQPSEKTEEEILADQIDNLEEAVEDLKENRSEEDDIDTEEDPVEDFSESTPPPTTKHPKRKRNSSMPYVAAAVIALLLIAGGAWYYSTLSTGDVSLTSTDQTTTTDATNQQNDNPQESADENDQDQQTEQNNNSQGQTASADKEDAESSDAQSSQESNTDAVEIEEGQTLWSLAEEKYGNPRLWPWIYGNNGSLENPNVIYAGNSLSVPLPSGPQNSLNATDSVGVAKGFIATYQWYKSNEESQAKNHLWAAKRYHNDIEQLADVPIDKTDLSFANKAR